MPINPSLSLREIRLQKLRAEHPEMFSVTGYPRLDLRHFQSYALGVQRTQRQTNAEQKLRRDRVKNHRIRLRLPLLGDCKVIDTRTDAARSRLYFELSNGQAVRADRATNRQAFSASTGRFRKGRRRAPFSNPLIQRIVVAEIDLNANRLRAAA